jgi:hypothetical protein
LFSLSPLSLLFFFFFSFINPSSSFARYKKHTPTEIHQYMAPVLDMEKGLSMAEIEETEQKEAVAAEAAAAQAAKEAAETKAREAAEESKKNEVHQTAPAREFFTEFGRYYDILTDDANSLFFISVRLFFFSEAPEAPPPPLAAASVTAATKLTKLHK